MAWYNYPSNFSGGNLSVDGLGTFIQYADEVANGMLGVAILVIVALLSFLGLRMFGTTKAGATSAFITWIISIFLWRLDLLTLPVVIMLSVVVAVIILAVKGESDKGL